MSNFNYMDNVPVKISENYKPPPRIYQLPQAIANKLTLPPNHYDEAPQYKYDFQLERKVLAKIPEWRRIRQGERESRRERKERREELRLRELEARQKQLLGAVSYPSAEDLSSSTDNDEKDKDSPSSSGSGSGTGSSDQERQHKAATEMKSQKEEMALVPSQTYSFYNILQPTILPHNDKVITTGTTNDNLNHASTVYGALSVAAAKQSNAFNYKDFEEDTSSPFDYIELKTINDLDILAQVLNSTQMTDRAVAAVATAAVAENEINKKQETKETEKSTKSEKIVSPAPTVNTEENAATESSFPPDLSAVQQRGHSAEACQGQADLNRLSEQMQMHENIPTTQATLHHHHHHQQQQPISTQANYASSRQELMPAYQNTYYISQQQQQQPQQHMYAPYKYMFNVGPLETTTQPQLHYGNYDLHAPGVYSNQNFAYSNGNENDHAGVNGGSSAAAAAYYSPTHASSTSYQAMNANNYLHTNQSQQLLHASSTYGSGRSQYTASPQGGASAQSQQQHYRDHHQPTVHIDEQESPQPSIKSKSVPDIVKELSEEVHNSEIRRTRKFSYNSSDDKLEQEKADNEEVVKRKADRKRREKAESCKHYSKLTASTQRLAKNISSMGFPLERVAKIAQLYGDDDKKIVEHLIPLSELMDLGFDEMKISEALIKFDNNKEKALEYLIS